MIREMTMKAINNDENSHPKTISDAIYLAANWIPPIESEITHQAFNISTNVPTDERNDKKESKDNKNKDERHPKKEAVDQDDKRQQDHNQKYSNSLSERQAYWDEKNAIRDAKKTCNHCNKKGHTWQNCPDLRQKYQNTQEDTFTTHTKQDRQRKMETFDDEEWEENTY
jgi:hypothetical protein